MNPRLRFKQADGTDYPDWEEKKLGEITEDIRGGFAFPINEQGKKTGELPFYKVSDMNHFNNQLYMNIAENNIDFNTARKLKCNPAPKDTIIFPKLGMAIKTNKKRILSKTSCYDNNIFGLIVNNKYLIPKFLYYSFVKLDLMDLAEMGNTIPSIRKSALENFVIKIPCLEEQQKIADFLSYIDEVILASDQEVKKLQELKKGAMQKIFSQEIRFKKEDGTNYPDWKEKKIGDICKTFSGGTPRTGVEEYYNGNINFIRSGEIHDSNTELFISEEGLKNSSAKIVNVGDILLALYGATSGEIDLSKINGAINQAILCIRPQEGFNKKFIVEIFRYNKNNILKFYLQGGQGNLSTQNILKLNFPFPCLEEQEKIGDFLSDFDEAISLAKQELEKWKLLKKGLLQQIFI